jgi:hypothetical protein
MHQQPNPVDRMFGPPPPAPSMAPHHFKKPYTDGFYNSYNGHEQSPPNFSDIRLHDPSILSTSPGGSIQQHDTHQRPSPPQQMCQMPGGGAPPAPGSSLDMSSLQQGLQELFPNANISFSGQQRVNGHSTSAAAPPGFQTPSYSNQLLCQQLQNENKVIKIQ